MYMYVYSKQSDDTHEKRNVIKRCEYWNMDRLYKNIDRKGDYWMAISTNQLSTNLNGLVGDHTSQRIILTAVNKSTYLVC